MADRTTAALFGKIFNLLSENPDQRAKQIAIEIWGERTEFDFCEYQMYCDEALIKLGLAKRVSDEEADDQDEVSTIQYAD